MGTYRGVVVAIGLVVIMLASACGDDDSTLTVAETENGSSSPRVTESIFDSEQSSDNGDGDVQESADPEELLERGLALVDQDELHACLDAGGNCEQEVPGLAECVAQQLICNERDWREQEEYWAPGQASMTEDEAISIARMYADAYLDDVESVEQMAVETEELKASDLQPALRPPALSDKNSLLAVTVHGKITNTDLPYGAEPQTYDVYTVVVDLSSGGAVGVCMGCTSAR